MYFDSNLEEYIINHSSQEDELLYQLNRQTNINIKHPRMLSGHIQGKFLEMISYMLKPKYVLEIGTYTGYSALCFAKGMEKDGKLITIDIDDELEDFTRSYMEQSNLKNKIEFKIGDALKIIPELKYEFDLVFIDAEKSEYCGYYDLVFDKLRPGGFIMADNVLWGGKIFEEIDPNDLSTKGIIDFNEKIKNDERVEKVIIPFRDGITLIRKK